MIFTANQEIFLKQQMALWIGQGLNTPIPPDFARLILGMTEVNPLSYDSRGNKDFQHNPLFWSGDLLQPVINQWLMERMTRQGMTKEINTYPPWPHGKTFAVCLTHDVDLVGANPLLCLSRFLKNKLRLLQGRKEKVKTVLFGLIGLMSCVVKSLQNTRRRILFDHYLQLEDSLGFRSTFFFFPDQASRYDLRDGYWYRHHDKLEFEGNWVSVQDLMRTLEGRGWEVGLHGTILSFDNDQELTVQKEQIERSLGSKIVSIRQHNLRFDITKTPKAQSKAGFKFDSTFGFNRVIGFRNGLALPFYHYDLQEDRPLPILQIPLHLQDTALLRWDNLDLAPELALQHARDLIDKVEKVNGLVTLLWHPQDCSDTLYRGWFWVYQELLHYIARKNAWVAPVRDVGFWWEQRRGLSLSQV